MIRTKANSLPEVVQIVTTAINIEIIHNTHRSKLMKYPGFAFDSFVCKRLKYNA